jgi:hypothetical protein
MRAPAQGRRRKRHLARLRRGLAVRLLVLPVSATILACDPGLHGAFAAYDGENLSIRDMPTVLATIAGKERPRIDEAQVLGLLRVISAPSRFVIEQVGGTPSQSAPAALVFGYGVGNESSLITPMKTLAETSSLFGFLAENGFDGRVDSRFGEAVIDGFFGKPAAIK